MIARSRQSRDGRGQGGQVLTLFAIVVTVMLLMAAVAVDVARFVSERRFLQNAADAAALAGAQVLSYGGTAGDAEAAARGVLTSNYGIEPTGNPASQPSSTPVYEGCTAPTCLVEGILIDGMQIRVALRNDINFVFGAVAGLPDQTIGVNAYAGPSPDGGIMPIAVRQFINPVEGPFTSSPCSADATDADQFRAVFATASTSCSGTTTDASGRSDPTDTNPGPTVEILGDGADANEGPSFRGFVALDIRNFANDSSRQFYNGVTSGTNPNTLKQMQADYISSLAGYPGPPFPPVVSPPDPRLQVAVIDGVSAGIAVRAFHERFAVGDIVMILVYNGTVNQVPEFGMNWPNSNRNGRLSVTSPDGTGTATFRVSRNTAFTGSVSLSTLTDPNDPLNPMNNVGQMGPITYTPSTFTPALGGGTNVTVSATMGALPVPPGVYTVWAVGQSSTYSYQIKYLPISLNVGGVTKDFTLGGGQSLGPATAGGSVTFTVPVTNVGGFGSTVNLTLERIDGTVVRTIATGVGMGQSRDVTIDTSGLSAGAHTYVVRGTGINADGQPVTHLVPLTVYVGQQTPGDNTYVDITGFALMEVMYADSNGVDARAITPVLPDMTDERLFFGRPPRLLPWDYVSP